MTDRNGRTVGGLILAFAGLGGTAAVIPAVLPSASDRHPADASSYLQAVPALFTGLLLGVLLSAFLMRVRSVSATVGIGSFLQAVAVAALILMPPALGFLAAAAVAGLGFGLVEAAGSALAREWAGESVTQLLAALTGTVAVTAAGCPLIVAFVPLPEAPVLALAFVSGLHFATVGILVRPTRNRRPAPQTPESRREVTGPVRSRIHGLGVVALALALYVGVESVFSGWSAVITADLISAGPQQAAAGTSAFWLLMAAGRFAAWLLLRSRPARLGQVLVPVTAAAALLLVSVAAAGTNPAATAALCGAIVFLGPCYSMILGIGLTRVAVTDAARVTGPLVACGALGGASIPWLMVTAADSPASRTVLILSAALLVLAGVLLAVPRRPTEEAHRSDNRVDHVAR